MNPDPKTANTEVAAAALAYAQRFNDALGNVRETQAAKLAALIKTNRHTQFGVMHDFDSIRSWDDYRRRVPLRAFEDFAPWFHPRSGRSEATDEPVRWWEPSGGSSGVNKQVPYTDQLLVEFANGIMAWISDLYRRNPAMGSGYSYWSISPPASDPDSVGGAASAGDSGDDAYFPEAVRHSLRQTLAVGPGPANETIEECRYRTLCTLLDCPELAFVSVWSPTFLTLLVDSLDDHWTDLRQHCSRSLPTTPPNDLGGLWPHLGLISCWADGHAGRALVPLRRRFPSVPIQAKGLLATEGVVSVPFAGADAPVTAVTSHCLEFLSEAGDSRLAHELEVGTTYEVVMTTGGGLYRYRLGDWVEVVGHLREAPLLRFVGRRDARSDLVGEKLDARFVEQSISTVVAAHRENIRFAMLAPNSEVNGYVLLAEPDENGGAASIATLAESLEGELMKSHHYRLARQLGQLRSLQPHLLNDSDRRWEQTRMARGQRSGVIKPPVLLSRPFVEDP